MTVAGVDLGGSKIAGVLLDDSGAVRGEVWQEHQIAGPDEAVDLIAEVVGELSARELAITGPARALTAVGLSVAGWLSRDRLEVRTAANLGLAAAPLAGLAEARLNCPVLVENDGNAAAFAEYVRGAGRSAEVLMLITLGTGVGGGIVVSGVLTGGSHGLAGELGHLPVELGWPGLLLWRPGLPGALRQWACLAARARMAAGQPDGAAILSLASSRPEQITARQVVQAARGGDAWAACSPGPGGPWRRRWPA